MSCSPILRLAASCVALAITTAVHAQNSAQQLNGQNTYNKICAYCHDAGVAPVLTGRQLPPEYVRTIVRIGNRAMPSFRESEISDEVLKQIAQLINSSASSAKQ